MAIDAAGRVLSYVLAEQFVDRVLYLGMVGTARDARGRGLSRACLVEMLRRAAATGAYDLVDLHVDASSPTGAGRLYERLGWSRVRRTVTYQRAV